MAIKMTPDELLAFLTEHLAYERTMLLYAYSRLATTHGLEWCATFECFALHARNIYDFLQNKGGNTAFDAGDYIAGFKGKSPPNITRLNESVTHLSRQRLTHKSFDTTSSRTLKDWIDSEWQRWALGLAEEYRAIALKMPQQQIFSLTTTGPSVAVSGDQGIVVGGSPTATNHVCTSSTISVSASKPLSK